MNSNMFDWRKYANKYHLSNARYDQIRRFCLGYPKLESQYKQLQLLVAPSLIGSVQMHRNLYFSIVEKTAIDAAQLKEALEILPTAANNVDPGIANYILLWATRDVSFDKLRRIYGLQCTEEYFIRCWRMFICEVDRLLNSKGVVLR